MLRLIATTTILFSFLLASGQKLTQTIRGTIKDQDSEMTLIGATVQIIGSDPIKGAVTDIDGTFRIEDVPVGRVDLKITYMGYEDKVIPNLLVSAAKELVLNVSILESISNLDAVTVTAKKDKTEVLNEMALVSARSFSVEETKRYAGSFADPARMVSAFAGVTSNAEGNNDIIVRGNSPKGILWRLEGVEIPNPNHFAWEGSTGGPINALNSNMLNDSDFFTGAFAPEYGNALSGVFDMKLKKGNNERREYTLGASTLGLDVTMEGPFKPGYNGSYLANYRYSSLQLIDDLGIVDFGGVPKYQDVSYNVYLPVNDKHFLSVFGLGGKSSIAQNWEEDGEILAIGDYGTSLGVTGITHNYLINDNAFFKNSATVAGTSLTTDDDWAEDDGSGYYDVFDATLSYSNIRIASTYNHKFNAQHKLEVGGIFTKHFFNLQNRERDFDLDQMVTVLEDDGNTEVYQGFASWKYRVTEDITMTSGLHYLHFGLNDSYNVEPRIGLRWKTNERQSFTAGAGIHSKVESISTYLSKTMLEDGTMVTPNRNLEPMKAAHFVLGYSYMLNPNTHFKVEAYYQHLYDVPVEDSDTSTFASLNMSDSYINKFLVNEGTGRNYGLEFTLERFLHNGFYYMSTLSLYESKYTAKDGIERQTAFNGNYVLNFLAGKEFKMGKPEKNRVFFSNAKVTLLGGNPYTPILFNESVEAGYTVRDEAHPFTADGDDVFIANLSIGLRRNKNSTTREFKIDVQNVTNAQAVVNEYFVPHTERIGKSYQLPMLPTISYTFSF